MPFTELQMLVMDVYNSRFHRLYDNKDPLSQIMDRDDTFVYVFSFRDGPTPNPMSCVFAVSCVLWSVWMGGWMVGGWVGGWMGGWVGGWVGVCVPSVCVGGSVWVHGEC